MRPSRILTVVTLLTAWMIVAAASTALAQFGHPLKGTWIGEWGPSHTHVVVEMNWDGKNITGTINPGAHGVKLSVATLDPAKWTVHLEADGPDATGAVVHYVIDGKVQNIGAYSRFITGTWTQGSVKGDFKITRT